MKLYVIRHGQTNCNKEHKYNCRLDEDINEIGIKQAEKIREEIKKIKLDLIICSPMLRTKHTSDIINVNKVKTIYDERIIERDGGDLTNTIIDEYYFKEYYNYYSTNIVNGLETMPELFHRIHSFIDDIKNNYNGLNILIVTHGAVARAIQFYFNPLPSDGMILEISGQKNCEIREYSL
ncbi:Phosphoserine phosphatase 1 [compost metagenome]